MQYSNNFVWTHTLKMCKDCFCTLNKSSNRFPDGALYPLNPYKNPYPKCCVLLPSAVQTSQVAARGAVIIELVVVSEVVH